MALDIDALTAALVDAFEQGMNDPDWTAQDAARAMAEAIDGYVRAAEVVDVVVDVVDDANVHIGTGTQSRNGRLE